MRFLLRVLGIFLAIYAALTVIRGLLAAISPARPIQPASAGRLVKDPVCGTYVPEASALHAENQFFCSEECRMKFLKSR
ncbi:MAG: hypothetical protein DMG13_18835 [Acidobacteria bacterium]|nr:MAG: hypothetical protein DMG13_18835 [Acidobacteriota bacterium]